VGTFASVTQNFVVSDLEGLKKPAQWLLRNAQPVPIRLQGAMGAGKTTFVRALGELLELTDEVSSPTFSIIQEYHSQGGLRVIHMDLYRIQDQAELFNIGVEDYFYSGDFCLVEWPERLGTLAPHWMAEVSILQHESLRHLEITLP
jgi:tRNA threonylcarbamoyladenosine biosynthesis protein TsaE